MLRVLALTSLLAAAATEPPDSQPAATMTPAASPLPTLPASVPIDAATRMRLPRVVAPVAFPELHGTFGGVRLADLVRAVGAPAGGDVRGRANAAYLLVRGSDGYVAIFTLVELDPSVASCAPILADMLDGMPLGMETGPLRAIAPCDRHPSRSVRNVVSLGIGSALPLPGRRVPLRALAARSRAATAPRLPIKASLPIVVHRCVRARLEPARRTHASDILHA